MSVPAFLSLRRAFFDAHLADEPEDATLLGVPDHDDRLRDGSPSGDDMLRARCQVVLDDLEEYVPEDSLPPPLRAERWALRTYALHHLRPPPRVHLEPLLLPYTVLQHQLAQLDDDPDAWSNIAARLHSVPEYLKDSFEVVSDHPSGRPVDRELAAHFARDLLVDAAHFLSEQLPALAPAPVREGLAAAGNAAADAFCRVAADLATLPQADAFDLGEEEVEWRLSEWYGLGPADEHIAAATDELRAAQADLVVVADRWSRSEDGPAITDLPAAMAVFRTVAARRLTDPSQLIPLYRRATERAIACIRAHNLFKNLPDPQDLEFRPTPPAIRRVITQASNWPAPLKRSGPAGFLVTEDPSAHPIAGAANLAVHEGIPGHALQSLSWQQCFKEHPDPVAFLGLADDLAAARDFWAPHLSIEGWAVYCEHLMHEHGLLAADEALFFHVSRAIRALRVILDLDLARGRLTRPQAAQRLTEGAAMPIAWSEGQVLRYTRIPLQAVTYRLGYLAFVDLQRRCRAAWGPRFTLAEFHAWALAWPPVPPARLDPADDPNAG